MKSIDGKVEELERGDFVGEKELGMGPSARSAWSEPSLLGSDGVQVGGVRETCRRALKGTTSCYVAVLSVASKRTPYASSPFLVLGP